MLFLVELDHVKSGEMPTPEMVRPFIEQIILPTLARIEDLIAEKKIIAGGLAAGRIAPRLIVEADTATALTPYPLRKFHSAFGILHQDTVDISRQFE
jgi:hypothetical protein